jgi:acetyltransferase-like isoleucine patch superfamily enzyme
MNYPVPHDACPSLPENAIIGKDTLLQSDSKCFARYRSRRNPALVIGQGCRIDYVHFALGETAQVSIGNYCCLTSVILLCEAEIHIGNYVMVGWNTTIADSDFHPLDPAQRIVDAIACSPLARPKLRPPLAAQAVIIEDDVWIGPNSTLLKGVHIGSGAWIEPGSLLARDVPPRARVLGNPAKIIGEVNP